jgi:hypothetical protein
MDINTWLGMFVVLGGVLVVWSVIRRRMPSKKPRTSPDDVFMLNLTASAETRMRNAEATLREEESDELLRG